MSKAHPLVEKLNQHLRREAKAPPAFRDNIRIAENGHGELLDNTIEKEPSRTNQLRLHDSSPKDPAANVNYQDHSPAKKVPSDGGGSVGSNMKRLDLGDKKRNKRAIAAVDVTHLPQEGDRPAKQRSGPSDDAFVPRSMTQNPHRTSLYDSAKDQQPDMTSASSFHNTSKNATKDVNLLLHSPGLPTQPGIISQANINSLSSPENHGSVLSPIFDMSSGKDSGLLLQPETRPITQEQLVNEVKGIYAGLVMVEKKCVEIDQQQGVTTNKLSNEQWQALIALHRTLLHEHHDFFLASQHPSSSPALRRLATKYAMPARMWRHGIHSFLELLRHRLPDSLDHMLAFVYLAYSMMALLMESVPSFEETWIECLGDLARYRMAIEEVDLRDREVWSGVARMWYNKAADKSPDVGRIQHHLAVLARPNIIQQLFYYSKALISRVPFQNARDSIMLLYNPFLEGSEIASQRYPPVESTFVKGNGVLFTHGSISDYVALMEQFNSFLDAHVGRVTAKFRVQGPEVACSLCAATFDWGNSQSVLSGAFRAQEEQRKSQYEASQGTLMQPETVTEEKRNTRRQQWEEDNLHLDHTRAIEHSQPDDNKDVHFSDSVEAAAFGCHTLGVSVATVCRRIGDKNIVPFVHCILVYLWGLANVPGALIYVEGHIPWESIAIFLNTLGRSGTTVTRFEGADFPQPLSGTGRQLPEDFLLRGIIWSQHYFPSGFFEGQVVDEDERTLELPSHAAPRAERCLWLGIQLASINRYLEYSSQTKQFSITQFARNLEANSTAHTLDSRSTTMSLEPDLDTKMS